MSDLFPQDIFDLGSEVRATAAAHPDRCAVIEPFKKGDAWELKRYSYAQLSHDADTIAAALRARGYTPGLRTVFMAPPSYQACAVGVALSQIGITFLWIDPSVGYRNVAERLSRIQPEAFVGIPLSHLGRFVFGWGDRFLKKTIVLQGRFPGAVRFDQLVQHPEKSTEAPNVHPDDPCHVLYTTGSTGPAKPAMYTHRQFSQVYRTAAYSWRFDADKKVPVDMAAFAAFLFIGLVGKGTVVVPPVNFIRDTPATTPAKDVCDVIQAAEVQSLFASPAFLERVAAHAHSTGQQLTSLTRVIGGGAPMFAPLVRSLKSVLADDGEVWSNYGATEALPSTEMGCVETLEETAARTDAGEGICVGRPFPEIEIRAVGPIGASSSKLEDYAPVDEGVTGELIVRGPNISTAYFKDQESTDKNKLYGADGEIWHRLGDVGHLDEKGRIWVAGRVSQCVYIDGEALLPISIEAIFDKHPLVRRSGLAEVVDASGQKQAVVGIETFEKLSAADQQSLEQELRALCANEERLARVSDIVLLPTLPVDPRHNAKIERGKLSQILQQRRR